MNSPFDLNSRVLLFGANGQLGFHLSRSLAHACELTALSHSQADIARASDVSHAIRSVRPAIIINAAAYTRVDDAETNADQCFAINARAPELLALECKRAGALLVHYSTDYVYEASRNGLRTEEDPCAPLNVYGESKLAGELRIRASGCRSVILRTAWLYSHGFPSFAETMRRLIATRGELAVVDDQIGNPTNAAELARQTHYFLHAYLNAPESEQSRFEGITNVACSGSCSRFDFVRELARQLLEASLPVMVRKIQPVGSNQFPLPAARPQHAGLNTARYERLTGQKIPGWRSALREYIQICKLQPGPQVAAGAVA